MQLSAMVIILACYISDVNNAFATSKEKYESNLVKTSSAHLEKVSRRSKIPTVFLTPSEVIIGRFRKSEPIEHAKKEHKSHRYHVATVDFHHVSTPFIIGLWIFVAGLAKIGFHVIPRIRVICPESCVLIVVGVLIGLLLFYTGLGRVEPLTPKVFFLYLLPPIILDAGYFMPNRLFFDNVVSILMYAVVGTVWNTLTIGFSLWAVGLTGLYGVNMPLLDTLLFSSIVSAVDPVAVLAVFEEIHVNEVLYILVFGESLLNDAVTVVLYHMFDGYTEIGQDNILLVDYLAGVLSFFVASIGGAFFGVLWGILAAFLSRFTHHVLIIEPIFVFLFGYLSYLTCEMFHLSGIVALTFCGMTMKNYVEENISYKSHITLKYTMKMLASISESIIFMFLGVSTVNDEHEWNTWFVLTTIVFCSIYRSIGVLIQTWILNNFRLHEVNRVEQFIMAYGGLRGAVAFALILVVSEKVITTKKMMVTTVITVVYFTVCLQGITIGPLVRLLNVPKSIKTKPSMNERLHTRLIDHIMAGIENVIGQSLGNYHLRDKFRYYNNRFIRPHLLRHHPVGEPKIFETYSKLNLADAMNLVRHKSRLTDLNENISLPALIRWYTQQNIGMHLDESTTSLGTFSYSNELNILNLDIGEFDYSPSYKDITDAKLHHVLCDSIFKPVQKIRHYSCDMINEAPVYLPFRHKSRMKIRHMITNRNRKLRKGHRQNLKKTINVCSGTKRKLIINDPKQNNEAISRFEHSMSISEYLETEESLRHPGINVREESTPNGVAFVAHRNSGNNPDVSNLRINSAPVSPYLPPTLTETLPWKREDDNGDERCVRKQQEFPLWVENKEYNVYTSLTSNFLTNLSSDDHVNRSDVFELFDLNRPVERGEHQGNEGLKNRYT
ncbi:putative Na(+)/H(+) antiporter nhx-9 [Tachypleus tridentatus]|uniref:putative Na(+)/H(+) antiporter nhx-9 n=1 Tax=Tachypleus tridentatus TaxID=6853 RepID=UPI003FD0E5E8